MTKKTRDFVFIIFIFFFLILSIGISIYATGYKLNLRRPLRLSSLLIKTGMLVISTEPTGAKIYLNDRLQTKSTLNILSKDYVSTPAKIKNILPGDYNLRLEKNGYWPLQKKITINSGQTTNVENINLFQNVLPIFIASSTSRGLQLSPSRRYLYLPEEEKIISLKNEQSRILSKSITNGLWLKAVDRLSASGFLYDPTDETGDINYQKTIGPEATDWHYEETTGRLYYQTNNSLNRLEADGRTTTIILKGGTYLTYEPRNDHLFVVISEPGKVALQDYDLKTKKTASQIVLPSVGEYHFINDGRPRLSLYDKKNKTLYLINQSNPTSNLSAINNVLNWIWSSDSQLFYYNDWEIYHYDLNKNSSSLLTRVGEKINVLLLNPDRKYLVFSTEQKLNTIDLRTNLATTVFTAEKINGLALDNKNNILYFSASIGRNDGIYKLNLQ